jgi:hypothetical protein
MLACPLGAASRTGVANLSAFWVLAGRRSLYPGSRLKESFMEETKVKISGIGSN